MRENGFAMSEMKAGRPTIHEGVDEVRIIIQITNVNEYSFLEFKYATVRITH